MISVVTDVPSTHMATLNVLEDDGVIGSLLEEQGNLTAVERFSRLYEQTDHPIEARYYSDLLPITVPEAGEQLAFEVDLDRCSGCKACVAACHSLNGLDSGESWRDVGLLIGQSAALPVIQHVTTACHHCLDPACLKACPVDAYEKDPVTGIVKHLDDQCFGCQYCTLACPYDVPKFNAEKGIVRKCDMCADRLRGGEAPACVQSCPHEAIRIVVVKRDEITTSAEQGQFLPGAFDPTYTRPTTRFRASWPGLLQPADGGYSEPEHGHSPLAVMLVLTQLAVGGFLTNAIAWPAGLVDNGAWVVNLWVSLAFGLMGLGASLLHLGRPLYAYRAVLGVGHSWLSREVVVFGGFAKLALLAVAVETLLPDWVSTRPILRAVMWSLVTLLGVAGVTCSVMVYHVVRREYWRASSSGTKFAGTVIVLGLASALLSHAIQVAVYPLTAAVDGRVWLGLVGSLAIATLAKLGFEALDSSNVDDAGPRGASARMLRGPLKKTHRLRRALGLAGGVFLPLLLLLASGGGFRLTTLGLGLLAFTFTLAGELCERSLFFRSAVRSRMPGGLPA